MSDHLSMSRNRDPKRQHAFAIVEQLLDAIAKSDRWSIARRTTGQLLERLLAAEDSGDPHPCPRLRTAGLGLAEHPLAVVDDEVAVVIGTVTGQRDQEPIPVVAVLVVSPIDPRSWLVAALETSVALDTDSRIATVLGNFTEDADIAIIARHSPLDPKAVAIDWTDSTVVLRRHAHGTVTVADVLTELSRDRSIWPWLADDCVSFAGLYLRATHPELVREY
jgi:hypothetical protein